MCFIPIFWSNIQTLNWKDTTISFLLLFFFWRFQFCSCAGWQSWISQYILFWLITCLKHQMLVACWSLKCLLCLLIACLFQIMNYYGILQSLAKDLLMDQFAWFVRYANLVFFALFVISISLYVTPSFGCFALLPEWNSQLSYHSVPEF